MRLILANATRHHSFQTALAGYEGGILRRFVTGLYYAPNSIRSKFIDRALGVTRATDGRSKFRGRRIDGLPQHLITSIGWSELIEQAWHHLPTLERIAAPETATYLRHEAFDLQASLHVRDCDLFHGFEQCSELSLRRAKRIGAVTILDEPVIHRRSWDRLEAIERDKLGLSEPSRPFWFKQHIDRKYREMALADYFFVGLECVRKSFLDEGVTKDRIFLIPYGVDANKAFRPVNRAERSTFNILFVGQVSWYKGLHLFLDAFEKLDVPNVSLTILGIMHEEWRPYFERRFEKVGNRLQYKATVPRSEMPGHYDNADVFVFPSLGGGIGLATYEAMASGLPVITSDGDCVIRDGKDGLVVAADDTRGWVDALTRLSEDREFCAQLGKSAAARVSEFSWDVYRGRVQAAYREIAQREGIA